MKKFANLILVSIITSIFSIAIFNYFFNSKSAEIIVNSESPIMNTSLKSIETIENFTEASEKSLNAVVHVKNLAAVGSTSPLERFFGSQRYRYKVGTGSGVIFSPDGYIVTNNHVIENSKEIQVTLNNNKSYTAKLIGTDPNTDIALLKIDTDKDLPTLVFGDSDNMKIGEWVLAVGNPFNLTSTVTAGIISAKSRDLNPKDNQNQSFIQTDAAVNPGNSGGALVNTRGELIGINTAISSRDGSYIGYSFAIPSNIAKRVIQDLIEFGKVQRAILGVSGSDLNSFIAEKLGVTETEGFYVSSIEEDSGAEYAGIKKGDIIKQIDQIKIHKFSDLTGYIETKKPKESVIITILRDDKLIKKTVKLLKRTSITIQQLGINIKDMSKKELKKLKLSNGVKVTSSSRKSRYSLVNKIIIKVNDMPVNSAEEVKELLDQSLTYGRAYVTLISEKGEKERLIIQ